MHKLVGVLFAVVLWLPFFGWATARIVQHVIFVRNVEGNLKRAADANVIRIAEKELDKVVGYLEKINMTSGYTSVLYNTPDEDIGFWYQNLKASLEELNGVPESSTKLEKTNILMKLRETLIDQGQSVKVTAPNGISVFPHNVLYFWWAVAGLAIGIIGIIVGAVIYNK